LLTRIEALTELPSLILAVLMIPLILWPYLFDISPEAERSYLITDIIVWAVFLVDIIAKIAIAPDVSFIFADIG
jgi:hypothetical protein